MHKAPNPIPYLNEWDLIENVGKLHKKAAKKRPSFERITKELASVRFKPYGKKKE